MLFLFIASVVCVATAVALFWVADQAHGFIENIWGLAGCALMLVGSAGIVASVILGFSWVASEHKARILNAEYGTKYTQEDIFYASDVIDTIRNLDRKRIEVKGELVTEERNKD